MSVERVGDSKKSVNHIQKKSTPFLWTSFQGVGKSPPFSWTSFQGVGKSPPRVGFPPHFTAPQGGDFSPGGGNSPPPQRLIVGGISSPPPTPYKKFSHDHQNHHHPRHRHRHHIDKPAHLIIRLLFGFVSDSVSRKKVKVLRRQCCLSPYPSHKIFLSIVNIV